MADKMADNFWLCAVCLLRVNLNLDNIIEHAHGAIPTSYLDIGASQTQLLNEIMPAYRIFSNCLAP
jgi:hypothetical protein